MLVERLLVLARVAVLARVLKLRVDLRVQREDLLHQELPAQRKGLHWGHRNVHELSPNLEKDVVVPEEAILRLGFDESEFWLFKRLLVEFVADAHCAGNDEVHFKHLLFLVKNNVLVRSVANLARH